jgi:putative nucleotidyltransferase with HDIG domain
MTDSKWGITRQQALALMEERLQAENLRKHSLAAEAIMRELALRFNEDPDLWGIAGLLHDLDYNETRDNMSQHGLITERILSQLGVSPEITEAIKFHNSDHLGMAPTKPIHFAISAAETITGLIVATTLVYPEKKLAAVRPKSVLKRMKEKEFARAVSRDRIRQCEHIGIPLPEFVEISLKAMRGISDQLGL